MYEKMQQLDGVPNIPMAEHVSVGFGSAFVTKDNECFYSEPHGSDYDSCISMSAVEAVAANFPDSDWRVHLCGPLSEIHYQRQGAENWVAYECGPGFA